MLPLLTLLPTLFNAITEIPKLFEQGKEVFETVTGRAPGVSTPAELAASIEGLSPDQKKAWADQMNYKLEQYQAETTRLKVEQGEVTASVLEVLPPAAAAKVALMRMTTRPWAVRQMVRVLMLPFYIVVIDGALSLANIFLKFFGSTKTFDLLMATFFDGKSGYVALYETVAIPAASIVIAYMTLRQMEKSKGDANPLAALSKSAKGLFGLFKR
jgi:hypothetical protein